MIEATGPGTVGGAAGAEVLDRRFKVAVLLVTLAGAAWRVFYLIAAKWDQELLLNDSFYYSAQARMLAEGRGFIDAFTEQPAAEHAPLTSVLLAPASLLDPYINWQRSTNTLVGIITIPLIALVARRVAGRRVAVIAAVLAAVYPNLWMNDSLVMAESVSTLCAVLALWAALRHHDRFDWRSALLCGAAVGVAALARSELLLLAPLFALIGLRSRPFRTWAPQAVLVGVSAIAMMVPWAAFNLTRFDSPVLITTNEGNTLDGANCDETYYGPNIGGWSIGCVLDDIDRPGEDASERSRRQREEALTYVSDNRGRVPAVVAARLGRAADLYDLGRNVEGDANEERARWASWAGIVSWWVLAPLAVYGWWRRRGTYGWVLAAPAVAVVVTTAAFYGLHRLRSPIEPVVVICAAMAIASLGPVRRRLDAWVEGWPGIGGHREQRAAQDDRTAPRGARADVTDPAVASGGRS